MENEQFILPYSRAKAWVCSQAEILKLLTATILGEKNGTYIGKHCAQALEYQSKEKKTCPSYLIFM